tara:strand:+ start:350 stop:1741 length:1392 start_codon:yes stop_codon:yes gene_type:complete
MKPLNRPMFKMGGLIKEGIMEGIREPRSMGGIGGGNFMGTPMGNRMGYRTTFKPIGTTTGVGVPTTGASTPGFQFLEPGLQQEIMKQERARIKPPKPNIEQRIVGKTKGLGSKIMGSKLVNQGLLSIIGQNFPRFSAGFKATTPPSLLLMAQQATYESQRPKTYEELQFMRETGPLDETMSEEDLNQYFKTKQELSESGTPLPDDRGFLNKTFNPFTALTGLPSGEDAEKVVETKKIIEAKNKKTTNELKEEIEKPEVDEKGNLKKGTSIERLLKAATDQSRVGAVGDALINVGRDIRTQGLDEDTIGRAIDITSKSFDKDSEFRQQIELAKLNQLFKLEQLEATNKGKKSQVEQNYDFFREKGFSQTASLNMAQGKAGTFEEAYGQFKKQGVTTIDAVANAGKTIGGAAFKDRLKDEDELTKFIASPAYDPKEDDGLYALKGELITIKDGKIVDRLTLATID